MSNLTVELPCQYFSKGEIYSDDIAGKFVKHDCVKKYRRVRSDHVALLWQHAHAADIQDNQGFIVRYVNTQGEQVGTQEIWTYFEKMGPRFLQTLN